MSNYKRFYSILSLIAFFASCQHAGSGGSTEASSDRNNIPSFFLSRFPNAQFVECDTLDKGFEFTFSNGQNDCQAIFDAHGNYVSNTVTLDQGALPSAALDYIRARYPIGEISLVELAESGTGKMFHVELATATDYTNLDFDPDGKVVKEVVSPLSREEMEESEEEGVDE